MFITNLLNTGSLLSRLIIVFKVIRRDAAIHPLLTA
jgi:hypothetical protein